MLPVAEKHKAKVGRYVTIGPNYRPTYTFGLDTVSGIFLHEY